MSESFNTSEISADIQQIIQSDVEKDIALLETDPEFPEEMAEFYEPILTDEKESSYLFYEWVNNQ